MTLEQSPQQLEAVLEKILLHVAVLRAHQLVGLERADDPLELLPGCGKLIQALANVVCFHLGASLRPMLFLNS